MLTGKEEDGANATELPKCKSVDGKLMCKFPGSAEYVAVPDDFNEIFSPEVRF